MPSSSIVQSFHVVAARTPGSAALSWRQVHWTYEDLRAAVSMAQRAIATRGLPRNARVALLLRNSPQYVALFYGALAAGCTVVPLNTQERAGILARQVEHCGARLLIADPEHPELPALRALIASETEVLPIGLHEESALPTFSMELSSGAGGDPAVGVDSGDLAAIIYTSGTTGRPKGVMLSHGNLASNAAAIASYLGLGPADRGLCVLPFHFSYGNSVLHSHLSSGAALVLEDNFAYPHLTLQRMQDAVVTGFAGVPSTFALLLGRCQLEDFDLRKLRYVTQAGGAMPRPLIQRLHRQLPHVQLFIMYGQTEATARLTYLPPARLEEKFGSVGIPIDGMEIEVRREGRALPSNEIGEVHARGSSVMLGYWNDPEATSEVLRDGWLNTGDLGHLDEDGYLYIDGRAVEMIKVGAFRVSPQEVEEAIAALPDVEEVAVTAIEDDLLGQAVKAVIVPRPGAQIDVRLVRAHCRMHLANYKIPKVVEFATMLPRTSSGKIQRYKLAREIPS
jgi:acyl-CoA synthetase (AMP-forming)/AMP-acid ligase II